MDRDSIHPIIECPHLYDIIGLNFQVNEDNPEESFIDLVLKKDGVVRRLRFYGPKNLIIEEGFPTPTGGMQILDVSARQLEDVGVEVSDFEASHGSVTFLAKRVVDLDAQQNASNH